METLLNFSSNNPVLTVIMLITFLWFCNLIRLTIRPPTYCSCQEPCDEDDE